MSKNLNENKADLKDGILVNPVGYLSPIKVTKNGVVSVNKEYRRKGYFSSDLERSKR